MQRRVVSQDIVVLGVSRRLLTRRSRDRIPLDHVLFILLSRATKSSLVHSWRNSWRRINSFRKRKQPAAVNQRRIKRRNGEAWGLNSRTTEAQTSTIKHSFRTLGGDGQCSWLNVYICGRKGKNRTSNMIKVITSSAISTITEAIEWFRGQRSFLNHQSVYIYEWRGKIKK